MVNLIRRVAFVVATEVVGYFIADSIIKKIGNTRAGFKEAEVEILDL